jgi:hypothetical protein
MYMKKIKIHSYIWDTTKLCETFNVDGATIVSETYEYIITGVHFPGMKGQKHSEETKKKMSEIAKGRDMRKAIETSSKKRKGKPALNKGCEYPQFQKGGKIISKEGEIIEFDCISHICKKLNLNPTHLGQVLSGKRKSHKGWKDAS